MQIHSDGTHLHLYCYHSYGKVSDVNVCGFFFIISDVSSFSLAQVTQSCVSCPMKPQFTFAFTGWMHPSVNINSKRFSRSLKEELKVSSTIYIT